MLLPGLLLLAGLGGGTNNGYQQCQRGACRKVGDRELGFQWDQPVLLNLTSVIRFEKYSINI